MSSVVLMPEYTMEGVALAICAASGFTFGGGIGQGACKNLYKNSCCFERARLQSCGKWLKT